MGVIAKMHGILDAECKRAASTPTSTIVKSSFAELVYRSIQTKAGMAELSVVENSESSSWLHSVKSAVIVAANFATSILLVNSVKYVYMAYDFKFPFFIACTHMLLSWAGTGLSVHVRRRSKEDRLMPWSERVAKVLPFTTANAASMGCANMALMFIYPSFHEMIQSTTPLFTLLASMSIDGKRYNNWAFVAMVPLCGGAMMSSIQEVNFSVPGTLLSIAAVVFRGVKILLQGRLLCDAKVDSVTLCYYMAPFNLAIFLMGCIALEGWAPLEKLLQSDPFSLRGQGNLPAALCFSAFLACFFNIASYLFVQHLNPIGAAVISNAKTPATILASVLIFGNVVTPGQLLGFLVTFFGVWLHSSKVQLLSRTEST